MILRFALLLLLGVAALRAQTPSSMLIPFQGRLTDQQGNLRTNGVYTLIFNLYDQAVGGSNLWTERHEKVGVVNGMVNVFLGSITPLDSPAPGVDFSSTRYLGITVDADQNSNTSDPEMVPRQMIIPAFWAKAANNALKLRDLDWAAVFGSPTPLPTDKLRVDRIPEISALSGMLPPARILRRQIGTNLADGQIYQSEILETVPLSRVYNFTPSNSGDPAHVPGRYMSGRRLRTGGGAIHISFSPQNDPANGFAVIGGPQLMVQNKSGITFQIKVDGQEWRSVRLDADTLTYFSPTSVSFVLVGVAPGDHDFELWYGHQTNPVTVSAAQLRHTLWTAYEF